jgi:hypothetical protein
LTDVPTTSYGSWANITFYSVTPEQYVADGLTEYATDYDIEAITAEFLAEIQAELPAGLTILGNGELIGPAYGPEADAMPEDVCEHVRQLIVDEDGVGGIDLQAIMDRHDLTQRAAWLKVYQLTDDGRREPVETEAITDEEHAHQVLRDLGDELSAADLGAEPGQLYEVEVTAGAEDDYQVLRSARVYAR